MVSVQTYLGGVDISLSKKADLERLLSKRETEKNMFNVSGKIKEYSLNELGLTYDRKKIYQEVLGRDLGQWLTGLFQRRWIIPALISSGARGVFDTADKGEVKFDEKAWIFQCNGSREVMAVNQEDLIESLTAKFESRGMITVKTEMKKTDCQNRAEDLTRRLARVLLTNLAIETSVYGKRSRINIEPNELTNILDLNLSDKDVSLSVDKKQLEEVLLLKGGETAVLGLDEAQKNLSEEVAARFDNLKSESVVLGAEDGPSTDGKIASKYIEVDLSQQKMYLWLEGKVIENHIVSTGLRYATPVGNYKILNKLPLAYSAIFKVWMPYWMAFNYATDIGAFLGIHELPYKVGVDGEKVYRFGDYIGSRMTGGCIALEPGEAKKVYDWADIGTVVAVRD